MNPEAMITVMWAMLGAVGTACLGLIVWGLKAMIQATFENTVAIKMLTQRVDDILKQYAKVTKLESDVNQAHSKIRKLENTKGATCDEVS